MKHAIGISCLTLCAATPAFAQTMKNAPSPSSEGVDYSADYLNDLLLRSAPVDRAVLIGNPNPLVLETCEGPPGEIEAHDAIMVRKACKQRNKEKIDRFTRSDPGPAPLVPSDRQLRPLPMSPRHPNAQN